MTFKTFTNANAPFEGKKLAIDYVLGNKKTATPSFEVADEDNDRGAAEELVTAAVSTTPSSVNEDDDDDALSYFQKLAEE